MLGSSGSNQSLQLGSGQQGDTIWPFLGRAEMLEYYLLIELQHSCVFAFRAVFSRQIAAWLLPAGGWRTGRISARLLICLQFTSAFWAACSRGTVMTMLELHLKTNHFYWNTHRMKGLTVCAHIYHQWLLPNKAVYIKKHHSKSLSNISSSLNRKKAPHNSFLVKMKKRGSIQAEQMNQGCFL